MGVRVLNIIFVPFVDLRGGNLPLGVIQFSGYPPLHLFCIVNRVSTGQRSSSVITLVLHNKTTLQQRSSLTHHLQSTHSFERLPITSLYTFPPNLTFVTRGIAPEYKCIVCVFNVTNTITASYIAMEKVFSEAGAQQCK
jgi:hypothetical protein